MQQMKALFCAALAALLAGCAAESLSSDPDVPIVTTRAPTYENGAPTVPMYSMPSQGFDPSPILTPNEENQDKLRAGAGAG
jgi:hypothetical protein